MNEATNANGEATKNRSKDPSDINAMSQVAELS